MNDREPSAHALSRQLDEYEHARRKYFKTDNEREFRESLSGLRVAAQAFDIEYWTLFLDSRVAFLNKDYRQVLAAAPKIKRGLADSNDSADVRILEWIAVNEGLAYQCLKSYSEAADAFRSFLDDREKRGQVDVWSAVALFRFSECLQKLGRTGESIHTCDLAITTAKGLQSDQTGLGPWITCRAHSRRIVMQIDSKEEISEEVLSEWIESTKNADCRTSAVAIVGVLAHLEQSDDYRQFRRVIRSLRTFAVDEDLHPAFLTIASYHVRLMARTKKSWTTKLFLRGFPKRQKLRVPEIVVPYVLTNIAYGWHYVGNTKKCRRRWQELCDAIAALPASKRESWNPVLKRCEQDFQFDKRP